MEPLEKTQMKDLSLTKQFELQKLFNEIDKCDDIESLRERLKEVILMYERRHAILLKISRPKL